MVWRFTKIHADNLTHWLISTQAPMVLVLHSTSTRANASRFRRGDSMGPHDHMRAAVLLMIVVVLVATGLVLKLYEAFNGVGGDIADQVHGDVTPDS